MSPQQMRETTMAPESRVLYQVKVDDIPTFEQTLIDLMGDDSEPRKKFFRENSDLAHIIN